MRATFILRPEKSLIDGIKCLEEVIAKSERIKNDPHTNKHYELIKGRMWKKGDGTGKYWHLLVRSRIAHRQALEMMKL